MKQTILTAFITFVLFIITGCASTFEKIDSEKQRGNIDFLITALRDEDVNAQGKAALALAEMNPPPKKAIPAIIESFPKILVLIYRDDRGVEHSSILPISDAEFIASASMLAVLNGGSATAGLKDINGRRFSGTYQRSAIVNAGAEALKKITGEDFGNDKDKWKQWWDKNKNKKIL